MTKFRQKSFGKAEEVYQGVKKLVNKSPVLPISTLSLGVSTANFAQNKRKQKQDVAYQKDQLEAMKHLTASLNKVDRSLEKQTTPIKIKKKGSGKDEGFWFGRRRLFSNVKFRRKDFSILSDTIKGASIGASIGTLGTVFAPKKIKNGNIKVKFKGKEHNISNKYNNLNTTERKLAVIGAGTLIGAALGALAGMIKKADTFISRSGVGKNLMKSVVENLKKNNFKEGTDFTRDPKIADQLKTKVCIVTTKISGDLRIFINTVADRRLESLSNQTVKNLPNTSVVNKKAFDKYNEITISTISDGSADVGLVTGICEKFIHSGYPVYLVEVG